MAKILVVDDSKIIADMLELMLTLHGHEPLVVTHNFQNLMREDSAYWNGVEALICDLMLGQPNLDGCEVLKFAMEHFPHVKRIVLSAAVPEIHTKYDLNVIADVVLEKPSGVEEILRML